MGVYSRQFRGIAVRVHGWVAAVAIVGVCARGAAQQPVGSHSAGASVPAAAGPAAVAAGYANLETAPGHVVRVPAEERAALEPYVGALLLEARSQLAARYGVQAPRELIVTLYRNADEFSRAALGAGQPDSVQGMIVGAEIAVLSPRGGALAWGRTLWHEVAHIFHQAASRGRVPRWFSEGLAEFDVGAARPSWARHPEPVQEPPPPVPSVLELEALLQGNAPVDGTALGRLYAQAFDIVATVGERGGAEAFRAMLAAWGRGLRTPEVVKKVLGMSVAELDTAVAMRAQERARARRPEAVADGLRQADASRRAGDRASALRALDAAAAVDAECVAVWEAMLPLAREVGDEVRVTRALERIAALDPYARDVLAYLLPRLAHAGRWAELESHARALLLIDPARPAVHHWLGRAHLEQGDAARAIDELDRALALGIDPAERTRALRTLASSRLGAR